MKAIKWRQMKNVRFTLFEQCSNFLVDLREISNLLEVCRQRCSQGSSFHCWPPKPTSHLSTHENEVSTE